MFGLNAEALSKLAIENHSVGQGDSGAGRGFGDDWICRGDRAVFSADGRRILTASWDKTARLWEADGKPLGTLEGHKDTVWSAYAGIA